MLKIENVLKCSNPLMHKIEVVVVMDNLFGRHICTVMKLKLEKHIKQQRGGIYNSMQRQLFDKIESIISSYIYFQGKILLRLQFYFLIKQIQFLSYVYITRNIYKQFLRCWFESFMLPEIIGSCKVKCSP